MTTEESCDSISAAGFSGAQALMTPLKVAAHEVPYMYCKCSTSRYFLGRQSASGSQGDAHLCCWSPFINVWVWSLP